MFSQCKSTFIFTRKLFKESLIINSTNLPSHYYWKKKGHLPREYSRIAWYFLARGGSISVKSSSHCRQCKQLCGGMEISYWVTFTFSRKATLNRFKALLKVLIYANLLHGVQMFSQISRIPDLIQKFWTKGAAYMPVFTVLHITSLITGDMNSLNWPRSQFVAS